EAGAGPGTLARTILAAEPACSEALRLVLVDPARDRWQTHPDGVEAREHLPSPGELGDEPVIVLANELLDNLPFGLVERVGAGWAEVGVGLDEAPAGTREAEGGGGTAAGAREAEGGGGTPAGARGAGQGAEGPADASKSGRGV